MNERPAGPDEVSPAAQTTGEGAGEGGRPQAAAPAPPGATRDPRIPAAALSERNTLAREKGLPGVAIRGGEDPSPQAGRSEERRYLRLLLVMVAIIVLAGFVLGLAGLVVGGPAAS